jgi:hypothetical protein
MSNCEVRLAAPHNILGQLPCAGSCDECPSSTEKLTFHLAQPIRRRGPRRISPLPIHAMESNCSCPLGSILLREAAPNYCIRRISRAAPREYVLISGELDGHRPNRPLAGVGWTQMASLVAPARPRLKCGRDPFA